jgi:RNA polymerase subunit RPABC4/transcription elongation factor Spt4
MTSEPPLIVFASSTSSSDSGPFSGVNNFFGSNYWVAFLRILAIFAIAFWLALVVWMFKDARRRIDDDFIVGVCVVAAAIFGPIAVLIYLILRPPEYLADVRERELEIRAMERRLGAERSCPYCRNAVESAFLACPHCGTKLKEACRRCKAPLDPAWRLCPYCETEVVALPPPPPQRSLPPRRARSETYDPSASSVDG